MTLTLLLLACGQDQAARLATPTVTSDTAPTAAAAPAQPAVEAHDPTAAPIVRTVAAAPVADFGPTREITIQAGETMEALARYADLRPEELARINGIGVRAPLYAGGTLSVPASEDFEARRQRAADARLQHWIDDHGGLVGLEEREVATGDTAWAIARDAGLPAWVFAAFNKAATLDRLAVGDTLYVPVLAPPDAVAVDEGPIVAPELPPEEGSEQEGSEEGAAVAEAEPAPDATRVVAEEDEEPEVRVAPVPEAPPVFEDEDTFFFEE